MYSLLSSPTKRIKPKFVPPPAPPLPDLMVKWF